MDKQEFKQRMRSLKSYRENNPGRGYWDWKVQAFEDGGEVGDPKKEEFYKRTGRSTTGRPLEEGLKPAFSIEDAANFTPVGDAISVKDTYDAVKQRDWTGAGLAAVSLLPFVPNLAKKAKGSVKKAWREIPSVDKGYIERQIDNAARLRELPENDFYIKDRSDVANAVNRVVEGLDETVYNRARSVDKQFNTKYVDSYDKLKRNYDEMSQFNVNVDPNMRMSDTMIGKAKTHLNDEFEVDVKMGTPIDDIRRYEITANPEVATASTINHEMGHMVDIMQAPGMNQARVNENPLLRSLQDADNFVDFKEYENIVNFMDPLAYMGYQRKGTEIKSFMNETRRTLLEKGKLKNLGDYVNEKTISDYMNAIPNGSGEKILYKTFKDPKTYLKWFNTIPVVGLAGAAYINKTNEE